MTPEQSSQLHAELLRLRQSLGEQLEASREGARPVSLDEPIGRLTRMDAIQQQKMTLANRRDTEIRLKQVEAALQRHAAGDYGDCRMCEEPIAFARLKVRPEAVSCIDCQSRREA